METLILLSWIISLVSLFVWMKRVEKRAQDHQRFYPETARIHAQKMARSQWLIEKGVDPHDAILIFVLQHRSWSNQKVVLYGRPEHPDYERFKALRESNVVDFQKVETSLYPFRDVAAYLRLGEISKSQ